MRMVFERFMRSIIAEGEREAVSYQQSAFYKCAIAVICIR